MDVIIRGESRRLKTRLILALLAVLGGLACAFLAQLGFMIVAVAAAPLAIIFLVESGRRRVFSIIVPVLLVVIDFILNGFYSFACLGAILVAVLISLSTKKGIMSKGEGALAATLVLCILIAVSIVLLGCFFAKEYTLSASLDFYTQLIEELKTEWLAAVEEAVRSDPDGELSKTFTPEIASKMFDSYLVTVYSFIAICMFLAVGLAYKLFSVGFAKHVDMPKRVSEWRFTLTPIYAYFYVAVYILRLFATNDVWGVAIYNLANVFMYIFAYVGILFANAYLKQKVNGKGLPKLLTALGLIFFSSLAVPVLAFIGVFATVMLDRAKDAGFGGNNGDNN